MVRQLDVLSVHELLLNILLRYDLVKVVFSRLWYDSGTFLSSG